MTELSTVFGVGTGDLQNAAIDEAQRIIKQAKGDRLVATRMLLDKLRELDLIDKNEVEVLGKLCTIGFHTTTGKKDAKAGYFEARELYQGILVSGKASPVALAFASSAAGSYTPVDDGSGGVVFKKSGGNWQDTLTAAGATIGGILGGPAGAGLGAVIGGVGGKIVDECRS
jgi:hypothetical protein